MIDRERVIRSLTWDNPNSLVVESYFSAATWKKYREKLVPYARRIANDFTVFGIPANFDKMPVSYGRDEIYEDRWGCVWNCRVAGMQGIISRHPLAGGFDKLKAPDPSVTNDLYPWDQKEFETALAENVKSGKFIICGYERLWERVHFLRGYENAMVDLALGEQGIIDLIETIVEYNIESTKKYLQYPEVDCIGFQDDWGEQRRLMVSPEMWREYFFEGYKKMFRSVKDAGKYVYFHTDGYLLPVIDDFRRAGVDVINLQSGCHTLDELYGACYRNICVSVDVDRQKIMPFAKPDGVKKHIRDFYNKLKGAEGGVWAKIDVYPDTPLANINAMCEVLDEIREGSGNGVLSQ